jgi:hypothetical protein
MDSKRQITTKTPSPAATNMIVYSRWCSHEQFRGHYLEAANPVSAGNHRAFAENRTVLSGFGP